MNKNFVESCLFAEYGFLGIFTFKIESEDLVDVYRYRFEDKKTVLTVHLLKQIHSNTIVILENDVDKTGDALISIEGKFVGIKTADCIPVIGIDRDKGVTFAIHCGWRGTAKKIIERTFEKLNTLGVIPENTLISIGPGICPDHYPVGEEVLEIFRKSYPPEVIDNDKLDLKRCIYYDLVKRCGVNEKKIENIKICTFEDKRFSSYRREGRKYSRQLSFVGRL